MNLLKSGACNMTYFNSHKNVRKRLKSISFSRIVCGLFQLFLLSQPQVNYNSTQSNITKYKLGWHENDFVHHHQPTQAQCQQYLSFYWPNLTKLWRSAITDPIFTKLLSYVFRLTTTALGLTITPTTTSTISTTTNKKITSWGWPVPSSV